MMNNTITRPISDYRPHFQQIVRDFLRREELASVATEDYDRAARYRDLQRDDALVLYPDPDGVYTLDPIALTTG